MSFFTYFKLQDEEIKTLQKQMSGAGLSLENEVSVSCYEDMLGELDEQGALSGANEEAFRALVRAAGQKLQRFADAGELPDEMREPLYELLLRGEVNDGLRDWLGATADAVLKKQGAPQSRENRLPDQMFIRSAFGVRKLYDVSASGDIYAIDASTETVQTNALKKSAGLSAISGLKCISVDRFAAAVTNDGHVVTFEKDAPVFLDETLWNDVEQVLVNGYTIYGVKKDGTVISTNDFECRGWTDITRLTVVNGAVVGVRKDGGIRENTLGTASSFGSLVNVADIVGDYVLFRNGRVKSIRLDRFVAVDMIAVCECKGTGIFLKANGTLESDFEPLNGKLSALKDVVSVAGFQNVLHFITRDGAYYIMTIIDGRVVATPFRLSFPGVSAEGSADQSTPAEKTMPVPDYKFHEGERIAFAEGYWTVLKAMSDKVLLLCSSTLERSFSLNGQPTIWRDSPLRQWLNGEYLAMPSFNGVRDHILPATLSTFPNPVYDRKNTSAVFTVDKVFCLSLEETKLYERVLRGMGDRWIMRTGGQNESFTAAWEGTRPDLWGVRGDSVYGVKPALYVDKAYLASVLTGYTN